MSTESISEKDHSLSPVEGGSFNAAKLAIGVKQVSDYFDKIGQIDLYEASDEIEAAKDIEAGLYADSLLSGTGPANMELSDDERQNLEAMSKKGRLERNNLVEANLRLVASIAKSFKYNSNFQRHSFWDLVQLGNEALIHAAENFDYRKGFKFSTYATWCIRDAISKSSPHGRTLTMSPNTVNKINKLLAVAARLYGELGRYASNEEIAKELKLRPNSVRELMLTSREPVRLDWVLSEDSTATLGEAIADEEVGWLGEQMAQQELRDEVDEILSRLADTDRDIINDRFGFNDVGEVKSRAEVCEKQGLSEKQLERRQGKIMKWFRSDDHVARMIDYLH